MLPRGTVRVRPSSARTLSPKALTRPSASIMASTGLLRWVTASQRLYTQGYTSDSHYRSCILRCQQDRSERRGNVPASSQTAKEPALQAAAPVRRLRRAERREQILAAATRAFARAGARLASAVGTGDFTATSVDALVGAAAGDPDGFRLLFRHAAREPEFRDEMDRFHKAMVTIARRELAAMIPDSSWAAWAARLVPTVAGEACMAWLDADQPDREQAAQRIGEALDGIIHAAQPLTG